MFTTKSIRITTLLVGAAFALILSSAPAGAEKPHDPSGNNGTVKIDGVAFDDHPDNEPHVSCEFQVDFYGFDEGDYFADVQFDGHAPTGGGILAPDKGSLRVFIGQDAAGGGTDLDASETYNLTTALSAIEPHPQQGWHVKLTIHAPFSRGADVKHKVFWIEPCAASTPETPPGETPENNPENIPENTPPNNPVINTPEVQPVVDTVVLSEQLERSLPEAAAAPAVEAPAVGDRAEVMGVQFTRASEPLAATGASSTALGVLGTLLLAVGFFFTKAGREPEFEMIDIADRLAGY